MAQTIESLPAIHVRYLGREDSPGEGNGNPLQCSCLENLMDREASYNPWDHKELDMTE